jgi:hypothetical protein
LRFGLNMACPEGIEPPTTGLECRCSIQLSYGQKWMRSMIPVRAIFNRGPSEVRQWNG